MIPLALVCLISFAHGQIDSNNIITSPSNCLPPKKLINGICRDVWRLKHEADQQNIITVPPNCKEGQELVNGECRDIWKYVNPASRTAGDQQNIITVPPNCKQGQILVNGVCRDIWRILAPAPRAVIPEDYKDKNTIVVPPNCKEGQQLINGVCRDIWLRHLGASLADEDDVNVLIKNIIDIPNQCPKGYRPDANGVCRPIL
ncbi:unnamed protein product [Pieris brassicae]|uniref:Uncharacterized protein n=1 Tax=Pieris brassicae TaxID=7116 RepID=A0A9P0XEK3_PIEBR|nr:unnamed protein product [Pieris brassicae]